MSEPQDMHGTLPAGYVLAFILLVLAGLTLREVRHSGGPEDDPVHGMYRPNPVNGSITANRERWVAELDATRGLPYDQRPEWRMFAEAHKSGRDGTTTPEQIAWIKVYYEWREKR